MATGSTPARPPAGARSAPLGWDVRLVLVGLLLTSLMSMLDQAVVATAGPTVVGELGGLDRYAWVFTAYMLAFSVTMPLYGKMGDLVGRKPVYLSAVATFLIGSAACGAAQTMEQLIALRGLQGLGGGGFVALAMAILGDLLHPRARARYQGYLAAVFALANLAGPLVGGVITDQLGWRWAFYLNLPFGLVALVLIAVFLPANRPAGRPRLDYAGAVLLTGFVVCTVLFTGWGGTRYPWTSPAIVGLGAAGAVLLVAWLLVERRAVEPLVPLRLFRDPTFDISIVVAFAGSFAFFGCVNFLPLFFQLVSGNSATQTGLLFVPAMLAVAVASLVAGQVIGRTGRYKWFPVASMALALLGTYLLSTVDATVSPVTASAYLAVVGLGIGLSQQVTTLAAQNTAPPRDLGVVTSTVGFLRNSGVWFGAAVFGAVINARLMTELGGRLSPDALALLRRGPVTPDRVATLPPDVLAGFGQAYALAVSAAFRLAVPVLLVGVVAALLLKDLPLQRRGPGAGAASGAAAGAARDAASRPAGTMATTAPAATVAAE